MSTDTSTPCSLTDQTSAGHFVLTRAESPVALIEELGIVRVTGKDAVRFLHGQFTNAVENLGSRTVLAGYCSPKGRLLATMRLWKEGDDVMMMLPKAVAPAFLKRLRMFVLRDDVKFVCACEDVRIYGVTGSAETVLEKAGLPLPAEGEVCREGNVTVLDASPAGALEGITPGGRRALVIAPTDAAPFETVSPGALWWASEIAAGTATVWPGTREMFVPQAVNYELTGGVVFNKGCYPGQEVISRVQHIGEASRRAFFGWTEGTDAVLPGAPVYAGESEAGFVIESVAVDGRTLVFFSALLSSLVDTVSLAPAARPIEVLPLPYKIRNVLKD